MRGLILFVLILGCNLAPPLHAGSIQEIQSVQQVNGNPSEGLFPFREHSGTCPSLTEIPFLTPSRVRSLMKKIKDSEEAWTYDPAVDGTIREDRLDIWTQIRRREYCPISL